MLIDDSNRKQNFICACIEIWVLTEREVKNLISISTFELEFLIFICLSQAKIVGTLEFPVQKLFDIRIDISQTHDFAISGDFKDFNADRAWVRGYTSYTAKVKQYRKVCISFHRFSLLAVFSFSCTTSVTKESYSRVNESKQQLNSFIIYNLDSIARVNERKKEEKNVKLTKMWKSTLPRLDLTPFEHPVRRMEL